MDPWDPHLECGGNIYCHMGLLGGSYMVIYVTPLTMLGVWDSSRNDCGSYYFNCSRSQSEQQDTPGNPNQEAEHRDGESGGDHT